MLRSTRAVALALAVAAVIGLALVVSHLVSSTSPQTTQTPSPPSASAAVASTASPRPRRPRQRVLLAMPAPAIAAVTVPEACAHGTGGGPGWWDCLPRSPSWDSERAAYLRERLAQQLGLELAPDRIECRTRCCRLRLTREQYRERSHELESSVGVRIGPTDGYMAQPSKERPGDYEITTCWKAGSIDEFLDRAIEREALLADAAGDLAACAHGLPEPVSLEATLWIGTDGELTSIDLVDDPAPGDAKATASATRGADGVRACVEAALRNAAVFEPPPDTMSSKVPVHVRLQPS